MFGQEHQLFFEDGSESVANNGNTLGKTYVWTFKTTGDDFEAPTRPGGSEITVSNLSDSSMTLSWPRLRIIKKLQAIEFIRTGFNRTTGANVRTYQVTGLMVDTEYSLPLKPVISPITGQWDQP